jgi:hypothetical protein
MLICGFVLKGLEGNYNGNMRKIRCFQDVWIIKFRWAKFVVDAHGKVHKVKSKVCTKITSKEKLIAPKLDNLWKHGGRKRVLVVVP